MLEEENAVIDAPASDSPAPAVPSQMPEEAQAPATEETPVTPPADNPAPAAEPAATTEAALYELPDGRKVDGKTLEHEWKNNFMPDYTRKSQIVAQVAPAQQQAAQPQTQTNPAPQNTPPWRDPDWVPQTYAEVIEAAKWEVKAEAARESYEQEQARTQINQMVDNELAEIRKIEPNLSEELLFQHATKYGFSNLGAAFKNMQDFNIAVKRTEQRVQQNIQNRAEDPVAVQTQQPGSNDGVDYNSISNGNASAADILRSLKGK